MLPSVCCALTFACIFRHCPISNVSCTNYFCPDIKQHYPGEGESNMVGNLCLLKLGKPQSTRFYKRIFTLNFRGSWAMDKGIHNGLKCVILPFLSKECSNQFLARKTELIELIIHLIRSACVSHGGQSLI